MATIPTDLHPETLLTTEQVAAITGLSKRAIEGWRYRKEGPDYIPLSQKTVRYRWGTLREWMATRTVSAA